MEPVDLSCITVLIPTRPDCPERAEFLRRWVVSSQGGPKCPHLFILEEVGRIGVLRNRLLEYARTPWVLYLDDDIVPAIDLPEQLFEAANRGPVQADIAYCDYMGIAHPGSAHPCGPVWIHHASTWDLGRLRSGPLASGCALYRTEALRSIGGWAEDLDRFVDWDLHLRMAEAGMAGAYVPEVLFHAHYLSGPSITRDVDYAESRRKVVEKHGL